MSNAEIAAIADAGSPPAPFGAGRATRDVHAAWTLPHDQTAPHRTGQGLCDLGDLCVVILHDLGRLTRGPPAP